MILAWDSIPEQQLLAFKGGEKDFLMRAHSDDKNRILLGRLAPGASIGTHTHQGSSEIIYGLEGRGTIFFDGVQEELRSGMCHYCPEGHTHSLANTGDTDLVFFAVVPQHR